jgi:hypothetical protein
MLKLFIRINAIGLAANKPTNTSVPSPTAASLGEDLEIQRVILRETTVQDSASKSARHQLFLNRIPMPLLRTLSVGDS